jgi:hypothetical protein
LCVSAFKEDDVPAGEFEKDFGYLTPFIERVARHAAGMADSAAKTELQSLVAGEVERWMRVRELLSAPEPREKRQTNSPEAASVLKPDERAVSSTARFHLTVGSLKSK